MRARDARRISYVRARARVRSSEEELELLVAPEPNAMTAFLGLLALRAAAPVEFAAQAQPNILMIVADGAFVAR